MPSIEILCVDASSAVPVDDLPFPVRVSADRRSHRGPRPRFQADFDAARGVLYHLGNPGSRPGYVFFAYELLVHADDAAPADGDGDDAALAVDEPLVFLPAFEPAVRTLLKRLLAASPAGQLLFTCDWQFGPAATVRGGPFTLAEFWAEHAAGRLAYNAAYVVVAARSTAPGGGDPR